MLVMAYQLWQIAGGTLVATSLPQHRGEIARWLAFFVLGLSMLVQAVWRLLGLRFGQLCNVATSAIWPPMQYGRLCI